MARCVYCKAETILYEHDVPVCLECADEREVKHKRLEMERQVNTILKHDVAEATERAHAAYDAFEAIVADVPSGLPHPDGTHRIHHASPRFFYDVFPAILNIRREHHERPAIPPNIDHSHVVRTRPAGDLDDGVCGNSHSDSLVIDRADPHGVGFQSKAFAC